MPSDLKRVVVIKSHAPGRLRSVVVLRIVVGSAIMPFQPGALQERLAHDIVFEDLVDAPARRQSVAYHESPFGNGDLVSRHQSLLVLPDAIHFDAVRAVGIFDDPIASIA